MHERKEVEEKKIQKNPQKNPKRNPRAEEHND